MKLKQFIKAFALVTFLFTIHGCSKNNVNTCRTCTARHNGSTIKTQEACSAQAEKDFKSEYHYAEVICL